MIPSPFSASLSATPLKLNTSSLKEEGEEEEEEEEEGCRAITWGRE